MTAKLLRMPAMVQLARSSGSDGFLRLTHSVLLVGVVREGEYIFEAIREAV
jgi:hypothetical protein